MSLISAGSISLDSTFKLSHSSTLGHVTNIQIYFFQSNKHFKKSYRMSLISAGSISLDSTFKYFPRILRGRRKNEDCAERNILGWKGLVPLIEIESKNRI